MAAALPAPRVPPEGAHGHRKGEYSGHETFQLRYGWLKKGVDEVARGKEAFDDASMVRLGVGKNMVKAIRHWGLVARVIEEVPGSRGQCLRVTPLGQLLFADEGFDPYLEDPRSLWLVHWQLCTHPDKASTWRWVFGEWGRASFSRDELRAVLLSRAEGQRASEATISRDVEVFLRTYIPARATRVVQLEDTLDSPLVELRLLREDPVEGRVEVLREARPSLDDLVLGYAVLDHWGRTAPQRETYHLDGLLLGAGAPCRVLGLDERAFIERLEGAEHWSRGALLYDHTAGMRQLLRRKRVEADAWLTEALHG
ncbi:MAG: DUF4007 family protein [Myxococcales bacterium]|nr:DUF4007 family protein [Myxococcales bacterium]